MVEAEYLLPQAALRLVSFEWDAPISAKVDRGCVAMIDLCLTPRPGAEVRFEGSQSRYRTLGELMFLPPAMPALVRAEAGRQRALQCLLPAEPFLDLEWSGVLMEAAANLQVPYIRMLCQRIADEVEAPSHDSDQLLRALATALAIDLARHFRALQALPCVSGGLAPWQIKRIDARVTQPGRPPQLKELGNLCGLSVRQMIRAFAQSRGQTIGQYIQRARIERAKKLLGGGESISRIATELGFASVASFSNSFRRYSGISPRQYRPLSRAFKPNRSLNDISSF
jgi:AraC family transcriptional regulator